MNNENWKEREDAERAVRQFNDYAQTHLAGDNNRYLVGLLLAASAKAERALHREEMCRDLDCTKAELKETKQLLAHKNETANTFMAQVKRLQAELANRRRFPIQDGPSVPWEVMAPHQSMAMANHSQTLERLAERGGLGSGEAWCVVSGIKLGCRGTKEQWDAWSAEWIKFAERVNLRCDELDRLRRQNHAMREALKWQRHECHTCHPGEQCPDVCVCSCPQCHMEHIKRNALKGDAGSTLLTREQVMPICEALDRVYRHACIADGFNVQIDIIKTRKLLAPALADARTLGLIEKETP